MRRFESKVLIVCCVLVAAAGVADAGSDAGGPVLVKLTAEQMEAMANAPFDSSSTEGRKVGHPKISSALLNVQETARARGDWRAQAERSGMLVNEDSVLTEMRLDPDGSRSAVWLLERLGGKVRHHNVPSLIEIWMPVTALESTAESKDVLMIRPARLVRPTAGSVTSEGVEAINISTSAVAYDYHDLGADGTGVTIANIDAGYSGYAALQASGDWPPPARLQRFEVAGGPVTDCDVSACSDYEAEIHGAATMELVYDVAPGANYMTYRTTTIQDWYTALVHAADNGADIVTVSLSAPLDNVGDGSVCPPNADLPCGTIAEAAEYARSQGVLMVTSAGNYRLEHWGGTYAEAGGYLDWDGNGEDDNRGGPGGGYVYCYPNGYSLGVDLFWDDWEDVDHDYDLYLYEWNGRRWIRRDYSWYWQNGGDGQTPQEAIRYTVSGAYGGDPCGDDTGLFAIRVDEYNAASHRNLQVFAPNFGAIEFSTPDRSLGFPADSPDVVAAGAVGLADPSVLEDYSSEGPVLGPGGSQAAPSPANPKPDLVSISDVSTVTYGTLGFGGTSSAAPHIAGVAAVLTQLRNEKYATPPAANNPDGMANQLNLFALEDPTFPAVHDTTYGNGLLKLRFCDETLSVGGEAFAMVGVPCNQRGSMTVGDVFGDILGGDWGMWTWDADAEAYDAIHSLSDPGSLELEPGVGYWVWYENPFSVTMQGLVHDRTEEHRISLVGESPGMGRPSLLGHPFDFDVAWPEVKVFHQGSEYDLAGAVGAGIIRNIMWKPYTPTGYTESDGTASPAEGTFNAFDGYWVKVLADCELGIPVAPSTAAAGEGRGDGSFIGRGWTVHLNATLEGVTAWARIGQLSESVAGRDVRDVELMPSAEAHQFYVTLPHPDWGEFAGAYVRDYHAPARGDAWVFEVSSNLGGSVLLRWDGPRHVVKRSVIIDLDSGEALPALTLQSDGYRFDMKPGVRRFQWRVR
ncbi:MAG: S8 family serine peptidase [Thermoanaerobaculales bacterium]|jgi:hypothetical protein|nr:S8 family serine peptidase [Thermoanaerobaculales bacterium]